MKIIRKLLKQKHIIIIGIISLLSTGIILSSNWNYFIQNNDSNNHSVSSYHLNTEANIYTKYRKEENSIMFQINVLKSAINKNNIMYQQYNNIFKHNINYVRIQKNTIRNRINVANSSIKHEIDILSNMKNIVYNHPYNYLKFFQSKNYTLPQIVSQKHINPFYSLNNIKTYTQDINSSNTLVKNISYQSEEAVIGIGAIASLGSASRTLIFSKIHFDYNSLYYFSSNTNNLSSGDNTTNNINLINKKIAATSVNEFINNKKTTDNNVSKFNPIKATGNLFHFCQYLKRNNGLLILGTVIVALVSLGVGALAIGIANTTTSDVRKAIKVKKILNKAYRAESRPTLSFNSFKAQIIRHAKDVENPNVERRPGEANAEALNVYIEAKRESIENRGVYHNIERNVNIMHVEENSSTLREGDITSTHGWYKMPVFETTQFGNLSQAEKTEIQRQIRQFEDIINHLPNNSDEDQIWSQFGEDIAEEILSDFREVALFSLGHLALIDNGIAESMAMESENTTVNEGATAQTTEMKDYVIDFWKYTMLRKENPADITHIRSITSLEGKLDNIAHYGAV